MKKILLLTAIFLFYSIGLIAQNKAAISSAQSGNWNTTTTWNGGAVPTANDDVTIANTHTVNVLSSTGVAESITVASGGTLRIYQTLTVDNASSNAGELKVQTGGTLVLSAGNFTNSGAITIAKGVSMRMADATTLTNSGTINITSDSNEFGALKLNGTYTKSGSGSVTYGRYIIGVNYGDYLSFDITGNYLCPPYPECIEDYVGEQDINNCN